MKREVGERKKTYSSSTTLEHGNFARGGLPLLSSDNGLEDLAGDVPQLFVVGAEQDNDAVGLGVERRRNLVQQVLDDLLNAGLGDGQVLGEWVVGTALLGQVDDSLRVGSHLVVCCSEES